MTDDWEKFYDQRKKEEALRWEVTCRWATYIGAVALLYLPTLVFVYYMVKP